MSLFYERSKKALEEFDDMKSEQKLGIKRDYSDDEKFLQSMGAYAKNISEFTGKLKQQEVHVSESNSTPKEKDMKRRMIQRQREKMAEDFNAKWYEKESNLKKAGS
jgi:copper homeostasis protein CutC